MCSLRWFLLIAPVFALPNEINFDDYQFGSTYGNSTKVKYSLSDFENNSPKSGEIIRTKIYIQHNYPLIMITNSFNEIVFGKYFNTLFFKIIFLTILFYRFP